MNSNNSLNKIKTEIDKRTADGFLSKNEVAEIMKEVRDEYQNKNISSKEKKQLDKHIEDSIISARNRTSSSLKEKIIAIINILFTLLTIPTFVLYSNKIIESTNLGVSEPHTINTIVFSIIATVFLGLSVLVALSASLFLIFNKRGYASKATLISVALTIISNLLTIMICGIVWDEVWILLYLLSQILLTIILQPQLRTERILQYNLTQLSTELLAKEGKLGYSERKNSFIKLDFFNIFWIFVAGCLIGMVAESIFHILCIWEPGIFKNRAGMIWFPFSPLYGFGAMLMTVCLNRLKNANSFLIFVLCTIIGGILEYLVSWFLEVAFSIYAWDYSDQFLNFDGRTCLAFASMFGVLGLFWIKYLLPNYMRLINKIPWKIRYLLTAVFATLVIFDGLMTLIAFDCWNARTAGHQPETPIELFFEKNYNDDFMISRFESMSVGQKGT